MSDTPVSFESWRPCPNPQCMSRGAARGALPTLTGLAHVRINARDLTRSVVWYRDVLGFDEPWFVMPDRMAVLFHPEANVEIVLRQAQAHAAPADDAAFDHVAFLVDDVEHLHAWETRLQGLGVDVHIAKAVGGTSIDLKDPDGNDVELFVYDLTRQNR
jgi:catechol-2,3-dioxygenase